MPYTKRDRSDRLLEFFFRMKKMVFFVLYLDRASQAKEHFFFFLEKTPKVCHCVTLSSKSPTIKEIGRDTRGDRGDTRSVTFRG
jgi:hypothetical protein